MELDVLLVNPASRTGVYQSLGNKLTAVENPVWTGLIAGYCRNHGLAVDILDAEAEELAAEQVAQRAIEAKSRLIAIVVYGHQPSASTQIMTGASAVCRAIKERAPRLPIVMIGGHVAALPQRTMQEEDCDFVAVGEGLATLVGLVEAQRAGSHSWEKIPGLWYRRDGALGSTPDVPLVRDLDRLLPGQPWDLLPMPRYRAHNWHCLGGRKRSPYAAIYTTLGCPFHCTFCCIQTPFKAGELAAGVKSSVNTYRRWNPKTVVQEIDRLVRDYGVRNLKIADEMFVLQREHVMQLCDLLIERNYDLNIWAYTRVDTLKPELIARLRAAGFRWLAFGIEAGSKRVRQDINKAFDEATVFRTVEQCRDAGIHIIANYIFGLPEDDEASMRETLNLALQLNTEFANFYCAMAYPGSPLYDMAVRQGVPLPGQWTGYSQHSRDCLPMPTRHLPARDVLRFRDAAFREYYDNPAYLTMIEKMWGAIAVGEIREMTRQQLSRDLLDGRLDVPGVTLQARIEPVLATLIPGPERM